MGWAGGSAIAEDVWLLVRDYVPVTKRKAVALKVIDRFEDDDTDTMDEAETLTADAERYEDEFFDRY